MMVETLSKRPHIVRVCAKGAKEDVKALWNG